MWNRDAELRRKCRKFTGILVRPQTYEQVRQWMKNRVRLWLGFRTVVSVAKGTSYVHAYQITHRDERGVIVWQEVLGYVPPEER